MYPSGIQKRVLRILVPILLAREVVEREGRVRIPVRLTARNKQEKKKMMMMKWHCYLVRIPLLLCWCSAIVDVCGGSPLSDCGGIWKAMRAKKKPLAGGKRDVSSSAESLLSRHNTML